MQRSSRPKKIVCEVDWPHKRSPGLPRAALPTRKGILFRASALRRPTVSAARGHGSHGQGQFFSSPAERPSVPGFNPAGRRTRAASIGRRIRCPGLAASVMIIGEKSGAGISFFPARPISNREYADFCMRLPNTNYIGNYTQYLEANQKHII